MRTNKIMRILAFVFIIATIAITLTTFHTQGQQNEPNQNKAQKKIQDEDLNLLPVADYDSPEPVDPEQREKRKAKNKRHDNKKFVRSNPRPNDEGTIRFDERPVPPAIPTLESEVIVIGEVLNSEAHLSNKKDNVYSEYTIRVDEILKNNSSNKVSQGSSITGDRQGGWVKYPNGQKVLYKIASIEALGTGRRYVLFLNNADRSPNYNILTGYELKEGKVYPVDLVAPFVNLTGMDEMDFIITVRKEITQLSQQVNNQ